MPALLARLALHPVLVELGDLLVLVLRELGEFLHCMLEDLVVNPTRARHVEWSEFEVMIRFDLIWGGEEEEGGGGMRLLPDGRNGSEIGGGGRTWLA